MNAHCLQWDGTLLERLQLSQLALGTAVPLGDPYLPAAASASTCCGTAVNLLWFPLLAVGQRSLCCGFLCLLWDSSPFVVVSSACCGTAVPLLWFPLLAVEQRFLSCGFLCLLCVSGPIILRRFLYRATANYDMGYPLYCENELPVTLLTLKLVLLGGRALQIFYVGGAAPFGGPSYFSPKVRLFAPSL